MPDVAPEFWQNLAKILPELSPPLNSIPWGSFQVLHVPPPPTPQAWRKLWPPWQSLRESSEGCDAMFP